MGAYTLRIQCELYYRMESLLPAENDIPLFAQIWMFDTAEEQLLARQTAHQDLHQEILNHLNQILYDLNS